MVRVAVIGTGMMGKNHARIYSQMENVELVGVSDANETTAKAVASEYGTRAYTDHKELIQKERPDAVSIAVPTVYHRDVAVSAMEMGVHVLLEKPIAHTVEAAKQIVRSGKENHVRLMVGHIERFNPAIQMLKDLLMHEKIGDTVSMSARRVGPFTGRITDVGVIVDVGVHDIDMMSYLYNDTISGVFTSAGDSGGPLESYAMMMLKFRGGGSGMIETNRLTPRKIRELTVTGTNGVAMVDYIQQTLGVYNGTAYLPEIEKVEPLKAELSHFVDCVEHNTQPMINGVEGTHALEVALAAVSSYRTNNFIAIGG